MAVAVVGGEAPDDGEVVGGGGGGDGSRQPEDLAVEIDLGEVDGPGPEAAASG